MIPIDLNYTNPSMVYLFLTLPLFFLFFFLLNKKRRSLLLQAFTPKLLHKVTTPRSPFNFWVRAAILLLAWGCAVLALMGPKGGGHYPFESLIALEQSPEKEETGYLVKREARDVIFLVDASASMGVKDTRTGVSRLDYAKEIVDEIIRHLKGDNLALYAFTSDTTKLSPLTLDSLFVRMMLRYMSLNEGDLTGTNIVEAVADMRSAHFTSLTPTFKTLVILTDGGDTQIEGLQGEERKRQVDTILSFFSDARQNHLRVFTIGMGSAKGEEIPNLQFEGKPVISSLDEALLEKISAAGGGKYYLANNWNVMDLAQNILEEMKEGTQSIAEERLEKEQKALRGEEDLVYTEYFQYPLAFGCLFLGFALFLPETRVRKEP